MKAVTVATALNAERAMRCAQRALWDCIAAINVRCDANILATATGDAEYAHAALTSLIGPAEDATDPAREWWCLFARVVMALHAQGVARSEIEKQVYVCTADAEADA